MRQKREEQLSGKECGFLQLLPIGDRRHHSTSYIFGKIVLSGP